MICFSSFAHLHCCSSWVHFVDGKIALWCSIISQEEARLNNNSISFLHLCTNTVVLEWSNEDVIHAQTISFKIVLTAVHTIRVPYICDKFHLRWPERVVFGKCQMGFKHTTFTVNRIIKDNIFIQFIQYILHTPLAHPTPTSIQTHRHYFYFLWKVCVTHLLQCVWRPDDHYFPSVEIIILNQARWKSIHGAFI